VDGRGDACVKPLANALLIVGDNPSLFGGLSRQCRDIACLAATLPQFRVGVLGRGLGQNRKLPFIVYDYPEYMGWGESVFIDVWNDFTGGEHGIILTTDDLSRRRWLVAGDGCPEILARFASDCNHYTWGYVPVDSTGPNGQSLPIHMADTARRYHRIMAASEWGHLVLKASGCPNADWMPHGIWVDKFHPVPNAKQLLDWQDKIVCGCVMANQSRKDYPVAFQTFAHLAQHYGSRFHAWLHTNTLKGYWDVQLLAAEYGVGDCLEVSLSLNDEQLAARYSACDCTVLPSGGEGFGYPIAESLACGTAAVVTGYAGGQELVPTECRAAPYGCYRIDTQHNTLRPILDADLFSALAVQQIDLKRQDPEHRASDLVDRVKHLDWNLLKRPWTHWLLEGVK
jgi:glycosyltransferase involved in cell wall biosynthesis